MNELPQDRFRSFQDWYNFLQLQKNNPEFLTIVRDLRFASYKRIEALRGRPLLVYGANFLGSFPGNIPNSIELSDVEGFTDLVNSIDKKEKSIDVLIHSPGGRPDAAERIVSILRGRFDKVHFLVPHSAYSAATMICLSGNTITLHPSATLGPIDPQVDGIPARSIKRGFEKIREMIKKEGPESLPPYIPLIEKYTIHLLEICDDSEKLSKELVAEWLKKYMFENQKGMTRKVNQIVKYFSDYDTHHTHARPISIEKIKEYNLSISYASDGLEEVIWEAYILLSGLFGTTPFVKIFENAHGVSWGKQAQPVFIPPPGFQRPQNR